MLPEYAERFESYDEEDKQRRIQKARTNFKLDGVVDYTKLSDKEKEELYKQSRILNETFLDADFEVRGNDFFEKENNIPLLFSFGLGPGGEAWLHIGSSHSSMTDFWAGTGILELREDGTIVERILSRNQYENIKNDLIDVEIESPMEAEKFLNRYRLEFLETLRPMDSFSEEFVFYYCLKLKLLERMRKFDTHSGETAYRKIYDSIMSEDKTEVIQ